ncbi:hypothetical protein [Halomicronema hongdechloris]|nr:hypothetical protein [Halomicronema hongdechloris]
MKPRIQLSPRSLAAVLMGVALGALMPSGVRADMSLRQYDPVELTTPQPVLSDSIAQSILRIVYGVTQSD